MTQTDISFATDFTPFIQAYSWNTGPGNGFGAKYPDPATLPGTECVSASFSPQGKDMVIGEWVSPWIIAYPWVSGPGGGFGAIYANPATLPNTSSGSSYAMFTPSGAAVIDTYTNSGAPGLMAYPWTTGSGNGFGAAYSNPGTNPGTFVQAAAMSAQPFSTSSDLAAVNSGSSPHVTAYPWTDAGGFGTKYANPATIPFNSHFVAFSPSGADIANVSSFASPFIQAYPWTVGTGWGAKYANPGTLPGGGCRGVQFSPTGADLATAGGSGTTTPYINAYPWVSGTGFGTKYADPTTTSLPVDTDSYCVAFSPPGNDVVVACNSTVAPWTQAYPWVSGTGFGTPYADPATAMAKNANAMMFNPKGHGRHLPLGTLGQLPSLKLLTGLALTKAVMDNPIASRRGILGLG